MLSNSRFDVFQLGGGHGWVIRRSWSPRFSRVGGRDDVGVCKFTSNFEITSSELNGTISVSCLPA